MSETEVEGIDSALDGLGVAWKRRQDGWSIPATARTPCEIHLVRKEAGVRIECGLLTWDEIGQTERSALSRLLEKAEDDLPGVRFEMRGAEAVAAVELPPEAVERGLGRGVDRLMTAARRLSRESAALLEGETAAWYLRFFAEPAETSDGPRRI